MKHCHNRYLKVVFVPSMSMTTRWSMRPPNGPWYESVERRQMFRAAARLLGVGRDAQKATR